jgi:hypothetical protein
MKSGCCEFSESDQRQLRNVRFQNNNNNNGDGCDNNSIGNWVWNFCTEINDAINRRPSPHILSALWFNKLVSNNRDKYFFTSREQNY